ncbi:hypothetical protein ED236_04915 [Pseudomethylobacillus aquaticus]|uniref:Uncharacterized protein n=1 Tax=Pseudomethylobacillus aquaticus TaxID=2676064 RepID=A0A3N0V2W2_9PROT|nr:MULTISPECIES: hypothetical protein [Methylophilaceae]ROH87035.1 hypothetical protein ED236_04915 [Pseudomethylobacillus aquaticus]
MPSLYFNREERVQDVVVAYLNPEASTRYSLTHGARYLPFSEAEKAALREDRAWALARLCIDKVMRLPDTHYQTQRQG